MIAWISSWAQGIVVAIIIATIIEMILPEGNNKKYIKAVIGVYILFAIISPIISKFGNGNLDLNSVNYEKYFNTEKYEVSTNVVSQNNDNNIANIYVNSMKSDIKQRLEDRGYIVHKVNIEAELENENDYGKIKKISLTLEKGSQKEDSSIQSVNSVNKVEIGNTTQNKTNNNTIKQISEFDKNEIKEYLNNVYDIEKKNIEILN